MESTPTSPDVSTNQPNTVDAVDSVPSTKRAEIMEQKKRVPRRLIHFTDGTIEEEYSTDEEEEEEVKEVPLPVDTSKLTWPVWSWHYVCRAGVRSLAAADFCGEKLAWFFGITTPKYQYIIDEYHRMKEEEEEEERREEAEKEQFMEERRKRERGKEGTEEGHSAAMEMGQVFDQ